MGFTMTRVTCVWAAAMLLVTCLGQADAQTIGSVYTSIAPRDDGSATRVCPGKAGLVVLIAEDDLREVVSVGRNRQAAAKEPAAERWFGPFNSTEHTVEWRMADGKPFAIIQRWHIADVTDPDKQGRPNTKAMLVVTRLPPGSVCHVAYVDAAANSDANELARKAADEFARDFKCGKDEVRVIGQSGRAVELVKR